MIVRIKNKIEKHEYLIIFVIIYQLSNVIVYQGIALLIKALN